MSWDQAFPEAMAGLHASRHNSPNGHKGSDKMEIHLRSPEIEKEMMI